MKQAVQHANDAEHNARVDCEGGEQKNGERIEQIKMAEQTDTARQRDQSQLAGSRLRLLKMRPRHFIVFLELSMKKVQRGDDIYNGDKHKKVGRQDAVPYPQDAGLKPEKTAQQITIQNLTAIGKFTVFNIKRPPCMRCISII